MADDNAAPVWTEQVASIQDAGLKESLSKFESQDKFFESIGYKPPPAPDWREQITDEDVKKFAAEHTDLNTFGKRAIEARKAASAAIIKPGKQPGKDADKALHEAYDKQVVAYRKQMGVPEKAEGYEFPALPAGTTLTDEMKAERKEWADRFHKLGVSNEHAKQLWEMVTADNEKRALSTVEADKAYVKETEAKLKSEWGSDFNKNKLLGNRAFRDMAEKAGLNADELTQIETKQGQFLLDHPAMARIFAIIGREMAEGTLGSTLSDAERETMDDQIKAVRKQQEEAKGRGDSKEANRLYQKEQDLIARKDGNQPVVGAQGRGV